MTAFDRGTAEALHRFGLGREVPDAVARGPWINPVLWALGALIIVGYLMIGHPGATVMAKLASVSDALDQPARSSMSNVLNAALDTVLAAGWLIGSAWLGTRSARISFDRDAEAAPIAFSRRSIYDPLASDR